MGDIKRKKNLFSRPRQLFNRARIDEEDALVIKYGLKNKKEIWKAEAQVSKLRKRAKSLIPQTDKEKKVFLEKLNKMGLKASDISDVLGLTKENWLDRRLQTFVVKNHLAKSPREARQLIVHKKVLVDGAVVNTPSFFVTTLVEKKITLKPQKEKQKKIEEASE
jgi:small subunit ribosomal protein S4